MEGVEAFLDGEWESLSKLFSCEDSDIHLHFNGGGFPATGENVAGDGEIPFIPSYHHLHSVSQESSDTTDDFLHPTDSMNFSNMDAQNYQSLMMPVFGDDLMEEILQLKAQMCNAEGDDQPAETGDSCNEMQGKTKYEAPEKSLAKRPCVSRNAQSRKKKKGCNEQSSTTCSSDSESNGKAKGSKGPATDAQSLYARKRRERINGRLKMLQNLVPNGTKVDISTMLEEAVHYVKFLQLQIKLLSSDDMWMYAPIAYNGMDMGLYQKINVPNIWPQN